MFFCSHRDEIAGCSEKGYDSLSVSDAKQMLMFSSDQDLHEYITEVVCLLISSLLFLSVFLCEIV